MPLNNALSRGMDAMSAPTKKQKLEANTPLRYFLRPILEEAMRKRAEAMQMQQQQMQQQAPTSSPLQGALMGREEML